MGAKKLTYYNKTNHYYPFGMLLPNRHEDAGEYRYGFQGMEKDDEVSGEGNSYDFGARMYNPRVGRWLSIDPKANQMPWQSPYCSMDNNPVWFNDPLGDKIKVGKKKEIKEFTGTKYIMGENGLVNTKAYNRYLKKSAEIKKHNAAIDARVTAINSTLNKLEVVYKNGYIVAKLGTDVNLDDAGRLDSEILKAINSKKTLTISTDNSNDAKLVNGIKKNHISINVTDFNHLTKSNSDDIGKTLARSQLVGAIVSFNTGSKSEALQAELDEINTIIKSVTLDIYNNRNASRGGHIIYRDINIKGIKGQVLKYNIRKGRFDKKT